MDRVGGMTSYEALCDDARAYEDVLIAMAGESDAMKIREMESHHG